MKRKTFKNLGGLQSLFFCVGIYTVALFFSIFVCSSVFYVLSPKKVNPSSSASQTIPVAEKTVYASVQ